MLADDHVEAVGRRVPVPPLVLAGDESGVAGLRKDREELLERDDRITTVLVDREELPVHVHDVRKDLSPRLRILMAVDPDGEDREVDGVVAGAVAMAELDQASDLLTCLEIAGVELVPPLGDRREQLFGDAFGAVRLEDAGRDAAASLRPGLQRP